MTSQMSRRNVASEDVVKAFFKSGLSQSQFSQKNKIPLTTLNGWIHKHKQRANTAPKSTLLPVLIKEEREVIKSKVQHITVKLGNRLLIKIPVGTPASWVSEVLGGIS